LYSANPQVKERSVRPLYLGMYTWYVYANIQTHKKCFII
jgi:hypothetical protein